MSEHNGREPCRDEAVKLEAEDAQFASDVRHHAFYGPEPQSSSPDILCVVDSYWTAHEEAVTLGYPSLTEALEALARALPPSPVQDDDVERVLDDLRNAVRPDGCLDERKARAAIKALSSLPISGEVGRRTLREQIQADAALVSALPQAHRDALNAELDTTLNPQP